MREELVYIYQLLKRLGLIILVFALIRAIFYLFNQDVFPPQSFSALSSLFFHALRFDLVAIIYINALFILTALLPIPQRKTDWYKKAQKVIFLTFNGIALAFEIIDIGFFKFAFRRSIGSDLNLFANTLNMIPEFIKEFWFLLVLFIAILLVISFLYNKTKLPADPLNLRMSVQLMILIVGLGQAFIWARGGFQLRPIMSISAAKYVNDMRLIPLMTNTSLNFIFSSQQRFLKEKNYFEADQLDQVFTTLKVPNSVDSFQRKNVMVIVLESFGKEYIHAYNENASYTPFLDSLVNQSLSFKNSFANGLRSTQGIVAITSSIPALMNDPLMFSAYQSNRVDGLAKLLKDEGYYTAFFHGANPGSMEFEKFAKLSGFEHYFDREAYGEEDFDGQWGIWDEPYFQYTAKHLNEVDGPFCALLFSLTSHHPYRVPKWFEKQYPKEKPVFRSVRYTDYALNRFFETAEKMPWFENTLFIITADHIGKSFDQKYKNYKGIYEVPILIYDPAKVQNTEYQSVAQHIDIMPTILDYLNYPKPFSSFGTSLLDTTSPHYAYMITYDIYQILDKKYLLLYKDDEPFGLFDHSKDPSLVNNLKDSLIVEKLELENQLKAVIQTYHQAMIKNELYLK